MHLVGKLSVNSDGSVDDCVYIAFTFDVTQSDGYILQLLIILTLRIVEKRFKQTTVSTEFIPPLVELLLEFLVFGFAFHKLNRKLNFVRWNISAQ